MSFFLVSLLVAQSVSNGTPPAPTPAVKQKPKQICESIAITGSRARQRVCHDVGEATDLNAFGVSNSAVGKATIKNADPKGAPTLSPG